MLNSMKRIQTLLAIYYLLSSHVIAMPTIDSVLLDRLLSYPSDDRTLGAADSNEAQWVPSPQPRRRNVITPRICYFARNSRQRTYQKLCLPYTDGV